MTRRQPVRLVVLGQGFVGQPLAVRAVEVGWTSASTFPSVRRRSSEDVTDAQLASMLASGRYRQTRMLWLSRVSTWRSCRSRRRCETGARPQLRQGRCRRARPAPAAGLLRRGRVDDLSRHHEDIVFPLLEAGRPRRAGRDFSVGHSPGADRPRQPEVGLENTRKDRLRAGRAVARFYEQLVDQGHAGTRGSHSARGSCSRGSPTTVHQSDGGPRACRHVGREAVRSPSSITPTRALP
jgi:UDP-N-acetyl-D-glucosamine dehydrogenase